VSKVNGSFPCCELRAKPSHLTVDVGESIPPPRAIILAARWPKPRQPKAFGLRGGGGVTPV
jgi:hypothetical protein